MLGPPPLAFAHRRQADSGHHECVFPCPGEPTVPTGAERTEPTPLYGRPEQMKHPAPPRKMTGRLRHRRRLRPCDKLQKAPGDPAALKDRRTNHGCWGSLLPAPTRPGLHQPGPLLEPPGGRGFPDEQASTSFTITQVLQTTVTMMSTGHSTGF